MIIPRTFKDFPSAYSELSDIPIKYQLSNYERDFKNQDTWENYFEDQYLDEDYSEGHLQDVTRAGNRWKQFCENECHHALAEPKVINNWCDFLLTDMDKEAARMNYLVYLNKFFRYLMWHVEYPHCYNPVQFAVQSHDLINEVWNTNPWEDYDV